jgi:hypothetical protein
MIIKIIYTIPINIDQSAIVIIYITNQQSKSHHHYLPKYIIPSIHIITDILI